MCHKDELQVPAYGLRVDCHQRGFALVSAIFILVILAALGGFIVTVSTTQSASQGLDIQGARAYQAARAGIEWGTYQVLRNAGNCPASAAVAPGGGLAGFAVTVNCTLTTVTEGGTPVNIYKLVSTASYGTVVSSPDYVERRIESTIGI
jgi:MSHA biogenesis protein MshP